MGSNRPPAHGFASLPPNPNAYYAPAPNGTQSSASRSGPYIYQQPLNYSPFPQSYSQGAMAAHALTSALTNPYGMNAQISRPNGSFYGGAPTQHWNYPTYGAGPSTTLEGYTLSSTYVPPPPGAPSQRTDYPATRGARSANANRPPPQFRPSGPATHNCTHRDCTYAGSRKDVELHMMDRHLIFPPGWKDREGKRKRDDEE
jgi:hypothetical protein